MKAFCFDLPSLLYGFDSHLLCTSSAQTSSGIGSDFEQDMAELNDMVRRFPLVRHSVPDHFSKFKTENIDTLEKLVKQQT